MRLSPGKNYLKMYVPKDVIQTRFLEQPNTYRIEAKIVGEFVHFYEF